ncbi:hypothetical protein Mapa_014537 [Marchantia paleacea]|nr:hypothetical protein Mapa_014537 [Marchantia paleacea]
MGRSPVYPSSQRSHIMRLHLISVKEQLQPLTKAQVYHLPARQQLHFSICKPQRDYPQQTVQDRTVHESTFPAAQNFK